MTNSVCNEEVVPELLEKGITRREQQVIFSILDGLSSKEIAERLGVTIHTIKIHLGNIGNKLELEGGVHRNLSKLMAFKGYQEDSKIKELMEIIKGLIKCSEGFRKGEVNGNLREYYSLLNRADRIISGE